MLLPPLLSEPLLLLPPLLAVLLLLLLLPSLLPLFEAAPSAEVALPTAVVKLG